MDERIILHCDLNNFFASVECLAHPELKGKPVAVCGSVEERHGIVLAKNEVAKRYGVKTAEAVWQAQQKCPDLVILPPHYEKYMDYSRRARAVYERYTDLIEPFGIDECWLDVSGSTMLFGSGETMANNIRLSVKKELGITISAGVSFNKIFAKLGSDMKKPDAVTVITRDTFRQTVWPLRAEELLGVGPSTRRKLNALGIFTIGDIAAAEERVLLCSLGKHGELLRRSALGLDNARVIPDTEAPAVKSIGRSTTCPRDLLTNEDVRVVFLALSEKISCSLRTHRALAGTVQISVRDSLLCCYEKQRRLTQPVRLTRILTATAMDLFAESWDWRRPIRSVGIRVCDLVAENSPLQFSFEFSPQKLQRAENLEVRVDGLRARFGKNAVCRAVLLNFGDLDRQPAPFKNAFMSPGFQ